MYILNIYDYKYHRTCKSIKYDHYIKLYKQEHVSNNLDNVSKYHNSTHR